MRRKRLLLFIVALEILIMGFWGWRIYQKKQAQVLGRMSLSLIEKDNMIFYSDGDLKNFYEPKASEQETVKPDWLQHEVTYTINSDSLNERFEYSPTKDAKVFRIITLGDSFTFGQHVNTAENWTEQLEDMLNNTLHCSEYQKFEVINLGMSGYDLEYSYHRYKVRGQKYHPDLVIWFIIPNSFSRYVTKMLEKADDYDAELIASGVQDLSFVDGVHYPSWTKAKIDIEKEYGKEAIAMHQYQKLTDFTRLFGGPIILLSPIPLPNTYYQLLKVLAAGRNNIYLKTETFDFSALPDGHPSPQGHTQIARNLFNYLVQRKIIPCQ